MYIGVPRGLLRGGHPTSRKITFRGGLRSPLTAKTEGSLYIWKNGVSTSNHYNNFLQRGHLDSGLLHNFRANHHSYL